MQERLNWLRVFARKPKKNLGTAIARHKVCNDEVLRPMLAHEKREIFSDILCLSHPSNLLIPREVGLNLMIK
ncbi:DNA polymerase epsilon catalytic subunit A-like [Pyrus ussuriensis x Pyrus communis]|uniref:DNA polymerase epsilon catalytic subunit A-like n=1 Tax=Pyrus ussuriensis x Pyrus communis TaxID=2448454 RepID=A0A5N5GHF1_9ROSA|nr:DNA polymerase epsilon catalytic subunit A-like [Pyrus ussuriensis x Pyrus communis]